MTTAEQLAAFRADLADQGTLLARIDERTRQLHAALIGQGSPDTLLERVVRVESEAQASAGWRKQAMAREVINAVAAMAVAVAAALGVHLQVPRIG